MRVVERQVSRAIGCAFLISDASHDVRAFVGPNSPDHGRSVDCTDRRPQRRADRETSLQLPFHPQDAKRLQE